MRTCVVVLLLLVLAVWVVGLWEMSGWFGGIVGGFLK
jgi:hypothetical protein